MWSEFWLRTKKKKGVSYGMDGGVSMIFEKVVVVVGCGRGRVLAATS